MGSRSVKYSWQSRRLPSYILKLIRQPRRLLHLPTRGGGGEDVCIELRGDVVRAGRVKWIEGKRLGRDDNDKGVNVEIASLSIESRGWCMR